MSDISKKSKRGKQVEAKNVFETIGSIGNQTANTIKEESKAISEDFFRQLLGQQKSLNEKRSGELKSGDSVSIDRIRSGDEDKNRKLKDQLQFERNLFDEERAATSKKMQELRLRLQAIQAEANKLIASTNNLTQEVKNTVMLQNVDPSEYQISYYESIISMIASFRKKVDEALIWFRNVSKREQKKNYWNQYKKKGASFLLSPDHYLQRSVG